MNILLRLRMSAYAYELVKTSLSSYRQEYIKGEKINLRYQAIFRHGTQFFRG